EREAHSWAALAEDNKAAKAKLGQIHREIAMLTSELETYGAAIAAQQGRIALARDAEASAARRADAEKATVMADRLEELAQFSGEAITAMIARLELYQELAGKIHREYGFGASPTLISANLRRDWSLLLHALGLGD